MSAPPPCVLDDRLLLYDLLGRILRPPLLEFDLFVMSGVWVVVESLLSLSLITKAGGDFYVYEVIVIYLLLSE